IAEHNVDDLSIWYIEAVYYPKTFLLELSALVSSISFQLPFLDPECFDEDVYPPYSYGMDAAEWVPIILEMFCEGKKLDKLHFVNHYEPCFFTSDCIKQFEENLPFLGKRICFLVGCEATEE
ncbi:hypothetical protein PFISCL1PPCAC_17947, partial [Pristionchus fissidentatus]